MPARLQRYRAIDMHRNYWIENVSRGVRHRDGLGCSAASGRRRRRHRRRAKLRFGRSRRS